MKPTTSATICLWTFLITCASLPAVPEFEAWGKLVSHRPDADLQMQLLRRPFSEKTKPWQHQRIEAGFGRVMFDYFPLVITKRPQIDGKDITDMDLLTHIRKNFGSFIDSTMGGFGAADTADQKLFESEAPVGAVMVFDLKLPGNPPGVDRAAVQLTTSAADKWIFTTVYGGSEDVGAHPVAGNREFGVTSAAPLNGCIFYTRGASRFSTDVGPEAAKAAQDASKVFWESLLGNVRDWVVKNGGTVADLLTPVIGLLPWEEAMPVFHKPATEWAELSGNWESIDKDKRFRIEFRGWSGKCDLVERNRSGKELRMSLPLKITPEEPIAYLIERPNDDTQVFDFYDFSEKARTEILKSQPQPSRLVFSIDKGKLKAQWRGLYVSMDGPNKIKEIKQPSVMQPKFYEFRLAK